MRRALSASATALALFLYLPAPVFSFGSIPVDAMEVGVSALGGVSVVGGAWRDEVGAFSDDLGQDSKAGLFPAFAASLFVSTRFGSMWSWGASLGAGSWGGRVVSEGGESNDRYSTIAGIGVELVPKAGVRLPLGSGEFGADLKLGLGVLASPLWVREAWADVSTTAAYNLSSGRRVYFLTGADLSYAFPVNAFSFAALFSTDLGFASFGTGSGTSILTRFCAGVGISRRIETTKGKGR